MCADDTFLSQSGSSSDGHEDRQGLADRMSGSNAAEPSLSKSGAYVKGYSPSLSQLQS